MERKTKKFIIEVEEGWTNCEKCPLINIEGPGECWVTDLVQCNDYNLATMKIKEYDEPNCYNLQCLDRDPNKELEEKCSET